jgi:hypothetical protein
MSNEPQSYQGSANLRESLVGHEMAPAPIRAVTVQAGSSRTWGIIILIFTILLLILNLAHIPYSGYQVYVFYVSSTWGLFVISILDAVLSAIFLVVLIFGLISVFNLSYPDLRSKKFAFYYMIGLIIFVILQSIVKIVEIGLSVPGGVTSSAFLSGVIGLALIIPCWTALIVCACCRYKILKEELGDEPV